MLSSEIGCPRGTNVGLDLMSIVPIYWSMNDTRVLSNKVPKRDSRSRVQRRA